MSMNISSNTLPQQVHQIQFVNIKLHTKSLTSWIAWQFVEVYD
jgi:hypothetical protein